MTIKIHIEKLVLDGLPVQSHDGPELRKAMAKELVRLLAEGGLSPELVGGGAYPDVPAGNANISGKNATKVGREIARAVYGRIGK
jgi:hypothetical protein